MNKRRPSNAPFLAADTVVIAHRIPRDARRLLFVGQPGVGKSTLAQQLAAELHATGGACWYIGADPGSPLFGVPGAVSLARWDGSGWKMEGLEALCTLDAARFRLPLLCAVQRLVDRIPAEARLLIDAPGVVRGVAAAELLEGLVQTTATDLILVVAREGRRLPLERELAVLDADVLHIRSAEEAVTPGKRARARRRTALWDAYLAKARDYRLELAELNLVGTPPPADLPSIWAGRQVALLEQGGTRALGEVASLEEGVLSLRLPVDPGRARTLLVRDAQRSLAGRLETVEPFTADRVSYHLPAGRISPPDEGGPHPVARVGMLDVQLVNGVFGDPLLHLRLRHERRSLLFDLGEGVRLSARIAHQISDVFISHAHMDHIGGFLWLMRSRIGETTVCRLWGPPGLADHVEGLVRGILWDRIGDRGPRFRVGEVHGRTLRCFYIQAGRPGRETLGEEKIVDGILLSEPGFRVRSVMLDHQTPVLAFAFEPEREYNVRKDRLKVMGLAPGPWLGELKRNLRLDALQREIELPDGHKATTAELARSLIVISPVKRLVYATDFADTPENRRRVIRLAHEAHTLFCEATFIDVDREQAVRTAHLTTRACGEIAEAAGVARLIPFHFSRRYEEDPTQVYEEIAAYCAALTRPR